MKLKALLILIGFVLLQARVVGQESESGVISAIKHLEATVIAALKGDENSSVTNKLDGLKNQLARSFDDTFKGTFDPTSGKIKDSSTLDKKIDLYAQHFYSWYTTKEFSNSDLSAKNQTTDDGIKKLLAKGIGYSTQVDLSKQLLDDKALLAEPIETGANNINPSTLGVTKDNKNVTPYGALGDQIPEAKEAPTINDLTGPDGYLVDKSQNQQDKAKLFMNYVLQSVPPPKSFYIPSKTEASDNKIKLYLPVGSQDSTYTEQSISTEQSAKDPSKDSEYDQMVKFLNNDTKYWQKYKMKTRAANILRTLYLETMFRLYQERVRDQNDSKSLVEREKEAAFAVLDKKYYEDLKKKSVADINLETLYAINKLVYFLYKIHQDNERSALLVATSGMQLTGQDTKDESNYIKPIVTLIQKKCWDQSNLSDQDKQVCNNPTTGSKPTTN